MTDEQLLAALKINLKITATAYDNRLGELIAASKAVSVREGCSTLDPSASAEDAQLVIMYASWLWNQRDNPTAPMPRMLRWALNNRIFSEKASGASAPPAPPDGSQYVITEGGDGG